MKIRKYEGANKLTRSNIISVAKVLYDGLTYEKKYAPAGWDFEFDAQLCNLQTGRKINPVRKETQLDLWNKDNEGLFKQAMDCAPFELSNRPELFCISYLPVTYKGSVDFGSNYSTHWVPTISVFPFDVEDALSSRYVYEKGQWYPLKVECDIADVPMAGCEWGGVSFGGAFVRFLSGLIF